MYTLKAYRVDWDKVRFTDDNETMSNNLDCSIKTVKFLKSFHSYILDKRKTLTHSGKFNWKEYLDNNKHKTIKEMSAETGYDTSTICKKRKAYGLNAKRGRIPGMSTRKGIKKFTLDIDDDMYTFLQKITEYMNSDEENTIQLSTLVNIILCASICAHTKENPSGMADSLLDMAASKLINENNVDLSECIAKLGEALSTYCSAPPQQEETA